MTKRELAVHLETAHGRYLPIITSYSSRDGLLPIARLRTQHRGAHTLARLTSGEDHGHPDEPAPRSRLADLMELDGDIPDPTAQSRG